MNDRERFLQCLRDEGFNPFRNDKVGNPWEGITDVPTIHADVSSKIDQFVTQLQNDPAHKALSVVIHGFAGAGKSHLLSRIRSMLGKRVYFTYIMPMAGNYDYWKYLQRQIVNSLLRHYPPNPKYTHLHYLICRGIEKTLPNELAPDNQFFKNLQSNPINLLYYINQDSEFIRRAIPSIIETIEAKGFQIEKEHLRVLIALLDTGLHQSAEKWLRCLGLENEECAQLGISQDYADEEFNDSMARQFILDLFTWSSFDRPIVLCFDQLDFYTNPGQEQKLNNYIQFVNDIVTYSKNVLCVSCILAGTLEELGKRIIDPATRNCVLKNLLSLQPIKQNRQIEDIIRSRLMLFHGKHDISDELFPFDSDFPQTIMDTLTSKHIEVYPRSILNVCTERYEQILSGQTVDRLKNLDAYLQETYLGRKDFFTKENAQIIDEVMEEEQVRRLLQCVITRHKDPPIIRINDCRSIPMKKKPWDFEFECPDKSLYAVEICESGNNSLYALKLGCFIEKWTNLHMASVYWIRRQSNSIKLGPKGQDRIDCLHQKGGFVLTDWSEEEWNSITALIWMLNEADGGNLLLGYDTISIEQVETWIAQSGVLKELPVMNALLTQKKSRPIRREILTKEDNITLVVQALESIVRDHRIIVFDKAYNIIIDSPKQDAVSRDLCLKALGKSDRIESSTMQNTQILYWIGS